jgi:thiamine-monophosphate kinase
MTEPTGEFSLIRSFLERWGDLAQGIGDDGAVLTVPEGHKLVVSTDSAVEDVHFSRDHLTPAEIGYRAAAAALSDLAAMAAEPIGLLFAVVLPESCQSDAEALADGVADAARAAHCPIVGGNISRGGELSITTTVLGSAQHPLSRSGARAGDRLFVTGRLGGASEAVMAWKEGREPAAQNRMAFARPTPRIREARWLAEHGATSAIDISDGLAADARHLAEAGKLRITIDGDAVPVADGASLDAALSGGEDYEILFTGPSSAFGEFTKTFNLMLTEIGAAEEGAPELEVRRKGEPIAVPSGYDHLARR